MPPGARPHDVDGVGAGDVARSVAGFVQRLDIGVEAPVRLLLGRIAPRHAIGLDTVGGQEPDHRLFRRQVDRVIFVDLRRHDKQRPLVHLLGRGGVVDEFQHLVAEDDIALGVGKVLADLEFRGVDRGRQAAILGHVVEEILQSRHRALAARIQHRLHRRRVEDGIVRRRHRVDKDRGHQPGARGVLPLEFGLGDHVGHRLAPCHIGLRQGFMQVAGLPGRVGEAAIARVGRQFGLAGDDLAPFGGEIHPLGGDVLRRGSQRLHHRSGSLHHVLRTPADQWIERKRILRGVFRYFLCKRLVVPGGFGHAIRLRAFPAARRA